MASLPALLVVLLVAIFAVHAAVPAERRAAAAGYDFDFRTHVKKLTDQPSADAPSRGHAHRQGCGCGHHDTDERDDTDDEELDGVPEDTSHHTCSMCGGGHADEDHHSSHAHHSDQAHSSHHSDHDDQHDGHHVDHHADSSNHSDHSAHHRHHSPGNKHPRWQKVYRFRIGMDMPRTGYLYQNAEGRLEGFLIDLIANVCRTAGKVCHPVVDVKDRCWESKTGSPGTGLVSGWYDGCMGFFPTPEKHDSFDFSAPFSVNPILDLHYPTNKVPADPTNLQGKRIGFVRGLPMNAACLARKSAFTGSFTPMWFESIPQIVRNLAANKIDAFPWMANFTEPKLPVVSAGPTFTCTTQGLSMMTRKGDPLLTWWDAAYRQVVQEGHYSALCRTARQRPGHKGRVYCLEE